MPVQSEMVCQKKKATARTMMAMSMGTTPVDDGGWAFRVDLYDSSLAGGSASVPLRRFFTLPTIPYEKIRRPAGLGGSGRLPMRTCRHRVPPRMPASQGVSPARSTLCKRKIFFSRPRGSNRQEPYFQAVRLPPKSLPADRRLTAKSQRYDFCQGLPSPCAFWQEKGR
ncbi:hypothetical protein [Azospirillum sp. B506]|uniref:hypothetical protein n=1 Tax=Azospirillum sp. B506 TaxID=137721 RepID=UPI0011DCA0CB|nr:hypothetical protein [Azospirillum sp. B506]